MLTEHQLNDYFALIGAPANFALYQNYYQSWLDYLNAIVVPHLNPNATTIRLVGMESSPANRDEPNVMSPNYIFNPLFLEQGINGIADCYIFQIYAGHNDQVRPVGLTRHQALVNLASQPIPVILLDLFHCDGVMLNTRKRRILALAAPVIELGICDRLTSIHDAIMPHLTNIHWVNYNMIFACPQTSESPAITHAINNIGLNAFPPTANTAGGGICPAANAIIDRIALGY